MHRQYFFMFKLFLRIFRSYVLPKAFLHVTTDDDCNPQRLLFSPRSYFRIPRDAPSLSRGGGYPGQMAPARPTPPPPVLRKQLDTSPPPFFFEMQIFLSAEGFTPGRGWLRKAFSPSGVVHPPAPPHPLAPTNPVATKAA